MCICMSLSPLLLLLLIIDDETGGGIGVDVVTIDIVFNLYCISSNDSRE